MSDIYVQECGGDLSNKSSVISVPTNDFNLVVDGKSFRFGVGFDGNLNLILANGVGCKFKAVSGLPCLVLTSK